MTRLLWTMILIAACVHAQVAAPATSEGPGPQPTVATAKDLSSASTPGGKVGLVRGVLKRLDPIHDQLLIHTFGGGDVRIAFDARSQLFTKTTRTRLTSIPVGCVVSVDTVIYGGKLFARSVRTGSSSASDLSGQVVRYDAVKSQLTLRDATSLESISLRMIPGTMVLDRGQPASLQALSPGMLVRVQFSPTQKVANNVEILAEPGNSFTFEGRIVAVDLRARVLALSEDSDQSVRELAITSLDSASLGLLQEGSDVSIQAEFDGDRYNARSVTVVSRTP
jgi:hypothetical protein